MNNTFEKKMVENIMNTKTIKLIELFSSGKIYKVPPFQRDYSWEEENWEELWEDITNIKDSGEPHYMGALIFKPGETDDEWSVVDGQQRLATLTILIVAAIKFLEDLISNRINTEDNRERVRLISSRFIGDKDVTSLYYKSKLHLNRNDDGFFQEYILKRKDPSNPSKLLYSQKLLYDCYKYFYKKISDHFKEDAGDKVSDFIENVISKKLIFIQITVSDDLNAYTVFETLNARGIELAPTDLLKNYLFSIVSLEDVSIIEEKWYRIVNSVGFEKFPIFLRYYLNSFMKLVRKERLFKEIKKYVKTPHDVERLLDDLESISLLYTALQNPYDDFWNEFSNKNNIIKYVQILDIFRVSQQIPLIVAVYKHKRDIMDQVLRIVTHIAFRYNIISKMNPNELEKVYNSAAIAVSEGKVTTAKDVFTKIKDVYVNDEQFVSMFSLSSLNTRRNKKIVKYLLIEIENYLSDTQLNMNDPNITIEHILPENPTGEWKSLFEGNEINNYIYRLGNLTLLEASKNKALGNKTFDEKKKIYEKSTFQITKELCKYEVWNPENIYRRQKYLSKIAKNIWRLDF